MRYKVLVMADLDWFLAKKKKKRGDYKCIYSTVLVLLD